MNAPATVRCVICVLVMLIAHPAPARSRGPRFGVSLGMGTALGATLAAEEAIPVNLMPLVLAVDAYFPGYSLGLEGHFSQASYRVAGAKKAGFYNLFGIRGSLASYLGLRRTLPKLLTAGGPPVTVTGAIYPISSLTVVQKRTQSVNGRQAQHTSVSLFEGSAAMAGYITFAPFLRQRPPLFQVGLRAGVISQQFRRKVDKTIIVLDEVESQDVSAGVDYAMLSSVVMLVVGVAF